MTILLWKVLDNRIVEECLGAVVTLTVLTIVAVLLPEGSELEAAAEFFAFFTTLALIIAFVGALLPRR